jgi:hypothetical protein
MRPSWTVARAALTAALVIGALPGLVGSFETSEAREIDAAAFDLINLATTRDRQADGQALPDTAGRSEGALEPAEVIEDPGALEGRAGQRADPSLPDAQGGSAWKEPRYVLTGFASFYDHGTTAMRLPSGTVVVICGGGGCIERVVNDYGPTKAGGRIVDMYRPDFFRICGCAWWSGTTEVTIKVY